MTKFLKKYYYLTFLLLILHSCGSSKKCLNYVYISNEVTLINSSLKLVQLNDTITLLVLGYVNSNACQGKDSNFSTCYGMDIKNHLFYKVNSLCHSDTGIKTGDFVKIAPQSYAFYLAHKSALLYLNNTRGKVGSPLNNYDFFQTFGTIIKFEN